MRPTKSTNQQKTKQCKQLLTNNKKVKQQHREPTNRQIHQPTNQQTNKQANKNKNNNPNNTTKAHTTTKQNTTQVSHNNLWAK